MADDNNREITKTTTETKEISIANGVGINQLLEGQDHITDMIVDVTEAIKKKNNIVHSKKEILSRFYEKVKFMNEHGRSMERPYEAMKKLIDLLESRNGKHIGTNANLQPFINSIGNRYFDLYINIGSHTPEKAEEQLISLINLCEFLHFDEILNALYDYYE
jgi:hypothetical protein